MKGRPAKACKLALAALMIVAGSTYGREKPKLKGPQFKYAGGTESLPEACGGNLELGSTVLTFKCSAGSIAIKYSSIGLMQYRPDISRQIRKKKLQWKVKPSNGGGKRNRYFTVLYTEQGAPHVIVLEVPPEAMRPYLAEIDLKAGKRVEVKAFEQYD